MLKNNTENFIACECSPSDADIIIFGAPFDGTTSFRPGTRFGPRAIRSESFGLETYSPYLDADLSDVRAADCGDIDLPFGNPDRALDIIEEFAGEIFSMGKIPYMLGGEHLASVGMFRAAIKRFPNIRILHFDAHADLRREYLGERLSHACAMRLCHDLTGDGKIFQFGIRSGDRDEFEFARGHTTMRKFSLEGIDEALMEISRNPVYLSVDLDVLDPSEFPGTGTPEAGGVSFDELRKALSKVCLNANVVALDAMELSPHYDLSGISTAAAGKIVRETLLALSIGKSKIKTSVKK